MRLPQPPWSTGDSLERHIQGLVKLPGFAVRSLKDLCFLRPQLFLFKETFTAVCRLVEIEPKLVNSRD